MMVMQIAYELGKFEHEVLALSPDEYGRQVAFLQIKADLAKRKGGGNGGSGGVGKSGRRQMRDL